MPLIDPNEKELERSFQVFHHPSSPLRALAEAYRSSTAMTKDVINWNADEEIARFRRNAESYVKMFTEAVDSC